MEEPIRVGILGGGQLADMLALAGYPLGLRFRVLDPNPAAPAGHLAERLTGAFDDPAALDRLADGVRVITYETETVPVTAVRHLRLRGIAVRPGRRPLHVTRDRFHEKRFLGRRGIPTAEFRLVTSEAELRRAVDELGTPVIAKTRTLGYDGRGQTRIHSARDVSAAWNAGNGRPLIVERFVAFRRELSLVCVRSLTGEIRYYPLVENVHVEGILRTTTAPAPGITAAIQTRAESIGKQLLETLDYVGVLAIELFETTDDLLVNELAPRVHNSGHWTIEGAACSQFENHLRAILGWPLRPTCARGHAIMLNTIGRIPSPADIAVDEDAFLHDYRKTPRPRRKVGHVTLVDSDPERLAVRARRLAPILAEIERGAP